MELEDGNSEFEFLVESTVAAVLLKVRAIIISDDTVSFRKLVAVAYFKKVVKIYLRNDEQYSYL